MTALLLAPPARAVQRVAFPWPRADCAAAARYVLEHRRPGEEVAGNHWEYAYYFRNLGTAFTLLERGPHRFTDRVWLVTTAATLGERQEVAANLFPGCWGILEQHDFARSTVFLIAKQLQGGGPDGSLAHGPKTDSGLSAGRGHRPAEGGREEE